MDYEIIDYEEGMEDYFCRTDGYGNIQEVSYIQSFECPIPCFDIEGELIALEEDYYLITDGFSTYTIHKSEL